MTTIIGIALIVVLVFIILAILSSLSSSINPGILFAVIIAVLVCIVMILVKKIEKAQERRRKRKEEKERAAFNKQILNAPSVSYTPSRESAPVNRSRIFNFMLNFANLSPEIFIF